MKQPNFLKTLELSQVFGGHPKLLLCSTARGDEEEERGDDREEEEES